MFKFNPHSAEFRNRFRTYLKNRILVQDRDGAEL
jgi:hypothetical protein